jgi:N-acetylmuramoyl-L-alanine amidase
MVKKTVFFFLVVAAAGMLTSFGPEPKQNVLRTIIIDAGHGLMPNGQHNGAKGTYSYEDEICYAVSKKLVAQLKDEFPEVKIIETRPTENIVDLRERAGVANRNRGDLFISIHVNAMPPLHRRELTGYRSEVYYTGKGKRKKKHTRQIPEYRNYTVPNTAAKGTQTYIWGAHKAEDKEIAVRENAPMLSEVNYKEKYGDIDPNSPEFIALSLVKTKQFGQRSAMLSQMVEDQFAKVGRISGGSRQRQVGIWVLQATAMPSILVETGFITNPQEEAYLNSQQGQQEISGCITKAVQTYISWLEKKQTPLKASNNNAGNEPVFLDEKMLKAYDNHHTGYSK